MLYPWHLMCQLAQFVESQDLVLVIHAFIIARVDYHHKFCVGLPLERIWELQLVQMLKHVNKQGHFQSILLRLHWLLFMLSLTFNLRGKYL